MKKRIYLIIAINFVTFYSHGASVNLFNAASDMTCVLRGLPLDQGQSGEDLSHYRKVIELAQNETFSFDPSDLETGGYWLAAQGEQRKGFYLIVNPDLPSGFMRIDLRDQDQRSANIYFYNCTLSDVPVIRFSAGVADQITSEALPRDAVAGYALRFQRKPGVIIDFYTMEDKSYLTSVRLGEVKRGLYQQFSLRTFSSKHVVDLSDVEHLFGCVPSVKELVKEEKKTVYPPIAPTKPIIQQPVHIATPPFERLKRLQLKAIADL